MTELKINTFKLFKSNNNVMFNVTGESDGSRLILKQSSPNGKNYYNDIPCNGDFDYNGFIFNPKNLGKSLTDIYEKEYRVRREVDKRLTEYQKKGYNVNKLITIEEVIADRITAIDGSIIRRLWDMILRALDALGITLDNGAESRYLIGMARRYVREGTTLDGIGVFSNEQIEKIWNV